MTKEQIIEAIEKMSVVELVELIKALEDRFGIKAQAMAAVPVGMPAATATAQPAAGAVVEEEKTEFDVILQDAGDKKIQVIKEIRTLLGLGLKEAKEFVESAPKIIKEGISKKEAEEIKKKLETVGAKVEIK